MYTIETLSETVSIVRLGDSHFKYGDPYEAMLVLYSHGDCVMLLGAVGSLKNIRGLLSELKGLGFKYAIWERCRPNGTIKPVCKEL